jgi:Kef-type K+ transport system membrane component KefB/nucleotide-binding universal stress UspA family protein
VDLRLVSPSEHQLLIFWAQLLVLLVTARALGGVARRYGQPAVVGELAAGLLLGPSVLGKVWGGGFEWLFPLDGVQSGMLFTVAWIGVVLLLTATGFETDLKLIAQQGKATAVVAAGSLLVPFAGGLAVGLVLPEVFVFPEAERPVFALFMATALSISSLPVIAKILTDLGLMRRNFGQSIIAAGMANDVIGWLLLGVVAGLATSGHFSVADLAVSVVGMALFVVAAFTVGQRIVDVGFRSLRRRRSGAPAWLTFCIAVALAGGVVTQWLGVEAVLGAFVAGILFGRSRFAAGEVREHLETVTTAVFAPIFFATAGLRVDLGLLADSTVLLWAVVVLIVASVTKFVGSVVGARLAGLERREGIALGVGLNARGAMEVVIATVGVSLGVLTGASYTIVVLMAMVTSVMAPPVLRVIVRDWRGTPQEQERLRLEEALDRNVVVRTAPVLVPTRGGRGSRTAAQIVHRVWPPATPVTLLAATNNGDRPDPTPMLRDLRNRPVEYTQVVGVPAADAVAAHALLGYGAVVVAADPEGLPLSPLVSHVLRTSAVPVLLVRPARHSTADGEIRRVLLPVDGTLASRGAEEVAFALAHDAGSPVVVMHVVSAPGDAGSAGLGRRALAAARRLDERWSADRALLAQGVLDTTFASGNHMGVDVASIVREAQSPGEEIVATAADLGADVVVIGATVRHLEDRAFVGHNVEYVLQHCDATVVVVAAASAS